MSLSDKFRKARLHPQLVRTEHTVKDAERALNLLQRMRINGNSTGKGREERPDSEDAEES